MKKNVASQVIGAQMVSSSDGSAFTGSVTVYVTGNGGTQAAGSVGSGACTHEGNGFHSYTPAQAETDYDHIAFTFVGTGAIPATVQVFPNFPQSGDTFARLGAPAGASVSADVAAVKAQTAAIETDTQDIQSRIPAALVSGRMDASVGAVASGVDFSATMKASINTEADTALSDVGLTTTITGRIDAAVSTRASASDLSTVAGYLDTEIAAILADTNELQTDWANGGRLDLILDALPTAAENATAIWGAGSRTLTAIDEDSTTLDIDAAIRAAVGMSSANLDTQIGDLPTNSELASAIAAGDDATLSAIAGLPSASDNATAVLGATVEGSVTLVQSIRLANSALGGKASGLDTTNPIYRDLADTKDRIDAVVDADGNRSAVTRDLS